MDSTLTSLSTVLSDTRAVSGIPSKNRHDLDRRQCLIYLIPGNPGLIAYYESFMKRLRQLLDESVEQQGCRYAFHIYGRNLLGFDDKDHQPAFGTTTTSGETEPFTLEDQIPLSRSGQKLDLIWRTPFLNKSAHHLAKGLINLLPHWLLDTIVRRVLRFPAHAAVATLWFLASCDGIWQALHMGDGEDSG